MNTVNSMTETRRSSEKRSDDTLQLFELRRRMTTRNGGPRNQMETVTYRRLTSRPVPVSQKEERKTKRKNRMSRAFRRRRV